MDPVYHNYKGWSSLHITARVADSTGLVTGASRRADARSSNLTFDGWIRWKPACTHTFRSGFARFTGSVVHWVDGAHGSTLETMRIVIERAFATWKSAVAGGGAGRGEEVV